KYVIRFDISTSSLITASNSTVPLSPESLESMSSPHPHREHFKKLIHQIGKIPLQRRSNIFAVGIPFDTNFNVRAESHLPNPTSPASLRYIRKIRNGDFWNVSRHSDLQPSRDVLTILHHQLRRRRNSEKGLETIGKVTCKVFDSVFSIIQSIFDSNDETVNNAFPPLQSGTG